MAEEPDVGRVLQLSRARDNATLNSAIQGLDANPDDAAKAVDLSRVTGTPASVIDMDLENFQHQQRTGIVGGILRSDPAIRRTVEQDPMFAKVGADDWGQTARVSQAAKQHLLQGFPDLGFGGPGFMDRIEFAAAKGFSNAFWQDMEQSYGPLQEEYAKATTRLKPFLYYIRRAADVGGAALKGASEFVHEGTAQAVREFGGSEETASYIARNVAAMAEWKMTDVAAGGIKPAAPELGFAMEIRFRQAMEFARPYIDAGKKPPMGVDRLVDEAYRIQAKFESQTIEQLLDEAHRSLIKERSPDMMVKLLQQHFGDREVAVPYDAVEKMYGKDVPRPGDGLLGDIPGFVDKYNDAVLTGGDIHVPIAEYVGRITPEARTALRDQLKPDPAGMNMEQAQKAIGAPIDIRETIKPPRSLVDTVRQSAGFEELLPEQIYAGLNKRAQERFVQLADKQRLDDLAWDIRKSAEEIGKVRTKQWLTEQEGLRPEVTFDVSARPEWVAHDYMENGVLRGVSKKGADRPKIDPKFLTPEQKKMVPKGWLKKGGLDPDSIANQVGFRTGDEMISVMDRFYKEKGEMGPTEYLNDIVTQEINQRLEAEYGKLPDIVLAEAQDHAFGQIQEDKQWAQTIGIAAHAGTTPPYSRIGLEQAVKKALGSKTVGEIDRDRYIRASADSGKKMAQAFLKKDYIEALKYAQKQHAATIAAREVKDILKQKDQFEKLMNRFRKSEIKGYDNPFGGAYVPRIQSIMVRIGRRIDRTKPQLDDALAQGDYGGLTLSQFVERKLGELKDIDMPPFLADERYNTPVEKMTVDEWRDTHKALKDLATAGREESVVYVEGQAHDLAEVKAKMIEKIRRLGVKPVDPSKGAPTTIDRIKDLHAQHLTMESILNRLDEDDPNGMHNQFIVRALTTAGNRENRLIKYYQKALDKAMGSLKSSELRKPVENSLWINPVTKLPMPLNRHSVLSMLAYWGSPSSRAKLLKGYNVGEEAAYRWLLDRTTKEDWDKMADMGKIFNRLIKEADAMRVDISGSPVKKIDLIPFDTPHGRYEGWYNPIDYSSFFPGRTSVTGEGLLEGIGFHRSTAPQATYAKERTGYVAPVELSLDVIPQKMREMIHDITFRPAVLQAAKIFNDPEWQGALINYYGKRYNDQMMPGLRDIANRYNKVSDFKEQLMENFRQNLINTMIGLNPHTVMKHGMTAAANSMMEVGAAGFLKHTRALVGLGGDQSWSFAMDMSEELQRRTRNWTEFMGFKPEIALENKRSVKTALANFGTKPVAFFDLMSAVPTWLAKYEEAMNRKVGEGQAVFEADRAVRRAHGSSAITNLPMIARGNAALRFYTSLYGFFSHMYQKQFEMSWKARDAWVAGREGDFSKLQKYWKDISLGFVSYVIIPAAVEEAVTPYIGSEEDSWGKKAAKTMVYGATSSMIGVKDMVHGLINMVEPAAGIAQSFMHQSHKLSRDLSSGKFDAKTVGHMIAESFFVLGAMKGYVNAEEGKAFEYMVRWYSGLETPKGVWDVISPWKGGLFTGETKKPVRRHY